MTTNVGSTDRTLRMIGGLILLALGAMGFIGWWGLLGFPLLATGVVGFCPAYPLLGISTCKADDKE